MKRRLPPGTDMERVLVIGCPGSGKTTLALELAQKTGLPLVHLDRLFWTDNWTEVPRAEFDKNLSAALQAPRWIIDGNYASTLPQRLAACDTVIYLDYSRLQCLRGVFTRVLRNHGKSRPDMGGNCPERFDWIFTKSVWTFNRQYRRKYHAILRDSNVNVHIFRRRREAAHWLETL